MEKMKNRNISRETLNGRKEFGVSVVWDSEERAQERDEGLRDGLHEREAQSQGCNKEACFHTGQNLGMRDTDWK